MNILSIDEIRKVFITTPLEENYNFLEADLVKLGNSFAEMVEYKLAQRTAEAIKEERAECIKVARSVNHLVADKIAEVRGKA